MGSSLRDLQGTSVTCSDPRKNRLVKQNLKVLLLVVVISMHMVCYSGIFASVHRGSLKTSATNWFQPKQVGRVASRAASTRRRQTDWPVGSTELQPAAAFSRHIQSEHWAMCWILDGSLTRRTTALPGVVPTTLGSASSGWRLPWTVLHQWRQPSHSRTQSRQDIPTSTLPLTLANRLLQTHHVFTEYRTTHPSLFGSGRQVSRNI